MASVKEKVQEVKTAPRLGNDGTIRRFVQENYKHFNAAVVGDAAQAWVDLLDRGGKMFLAMAGAMSTGELGISLAEMIRQGKIHGISTTGANVEEDIFNLIAHSKYRRIPHYRNLSDGEEQLLFESGLNRVTDTCIPEEAAMRVLDKRMVALWQKAERDGKRYFHYEFIYQLIRSRELESRYEIEPRNSWVVAACEKDIPIYTPGWEDSTLGNSCVAELLKGSYRSLYIIKSGLEQMEHLVHWYKENTKDAPMGFFQIGGGIAGDFPICVVPLVIQDLHQDCRKWGYFCQISDSTTSFGSYSGAVPNEKITWGKLESTTPRFVIESDAAIVAPLIFHYVLNT